MATVPSAHELILAPPMDPANDGLPARHSADPVAPFVSSESNN